MIETQVKERPILFSGPMVQAIRDGLKTQTRRVVKPQPKDEESLWPDDRSHNEWQDIVLDTNYAVRCGWCPFGQPGDRLWVRETFMRCDSRTIIYRADYGMGKHIDPWTPSIHMPRWESRLTLEVMGVRVERIQEISAEDILAEGITPVPGVPTYITFWELWDSINAKRGYSWNANPWVWVISFKVLP